MGRLVGIQKTTAQKDKVTKIKAKNLQGTKPLDLNELRKHYKNKAIGSRQ